MTQPSKRPDAINGQGTFDIPTKDDFLDVLQHDLTPEDASLEWILDRCEQREVRA